MVTLHDRTLMQEPLVPLQPQSNVPLDEIRHLSPLIDRHDACWDFILPRAGNTGVACGTGT